MALAVMVSEGLHPTRRDEAECIDNIKVVEIVGLAV